jgi:hypothetical protein
MKDHARAGVFRIGIHGTALKASWFNTVIATHGQMKPLRIRIPAAFDFTDATPIDVRGISVLLVASHNATLASDALGHVEMKAILLARPERTLRNSAGAMSEGSALRSLAARQCEISALRLGSFQERKIHSRSICLL